MPQKYDEAGATKPFDRQQPQSAARGRKSVRQRKQALFARTFLYAVTVILCSLLLAIYALNIANDALALMKPSSTMEVYIAKGSTVSAIARELKDAGLIEHRWSFKLFAKLTGNDGNFQYGTYVLNTDMDYLELVTNLQRTAAFLETVRVTIPEGYELREIVDALERKKVCSAEALWEAINTHSFDYWFLEGLPERDNRLEGYFFPDTYEFFEDSDADTVAKKFLDNFGNKFTAEMAARAEELGMTVDQVVTLASIIEREAAGEADRGKVASVFHNRLNSNQYSLLQSCATVQYILKECKPVLSVADTKIESPYNTYLHAGLPVGPIASPGLASLKAALYPETTGYYFFVVAADGTHIFSTTFAEHQAAVGRAGSSRGTGAVGS
ncbi:MAG: endolytic transglycosylase MltG [Clostridiales bacterium]|nr:endolytic transglycosylase MltG [Clostridiales bacterium]